MHTQQLDKTTDALEHAIQLNPADPSSLLNLGMAYLALHRSQATEKAFRAIITENAGDAAGHDRLGIMSAERGDMQSARREFQLAVHIDPSNLKYLLDLGILYNNMGDRKQSLRYQVQPGQYNDQVPAVRAVVREVESDDEKSIARP
jgi:Flp pilus assembly protein TadD